MMLIVLVIMRLEFGMVMMHVDLAAREALAKVLHQTGSAVVVVNRFVDTRDEGVDHVRLIAQVIGPNWVKQPRTVTENM